MIDSERLRVLVNHVSNFSYPVDRSYLSAFPAMSSSGRCTRNLRSWGHRSQWRPQKQKRIHWVWDKQKNPMNKSETNPKLLKFVVFGFGNWTKVAFKVAECSNSTMCSKDHTHGPMQVLEHLTSWSQEGVNSTKSSWQEAQLQNKIKTTRINWTNCFTKTYSNSKISKTPSTWHDALEWITPDLFLFRTSQVHVPYPATEDCNHCSSKIDG